MIVKNLEKQEKNTAVFTVESDAAEFEKAVNTAYQKNKGSINIPGFRKGKAPRTIIEGMFGKEVFYQDALDELAESAYLLGVKENELRVVGSPSIKNVQVTDERTALYEFSVTLYPEVKLGEYKGLKVVKEVVDVDDEDVASELESVRKRNARKINVERAAEMGDTANIDFDGYLNGERFDGGKAENYGLTLGSGSFVPGFEEQVVGMQIGEEKDIDITFPENYTPELAGKAVVFKVKLNSLTVDELPELDDEFAKDVSEFDTLEEYKADVRKNLESQRAEQAQSAFESLALKQASDNLDVDVPDVMIQEKAEDMLRNYAANFGLDARNMSYEQLMQTMGLDAASMNQTILPGAQLQVRTDLLLEAVAKAENFETSEDDLNAYAQKIADSIGAKAEDVMKYFGKDFVEAEQKKEQARKLIVDSAIPVDEAPVAEEKKED